MAEDFFYKSPGYASQNLPSGGSVFTSLRPRQQTSLDATFLDLRCCSDDFATKKWVGAYHLQRKENANPANSVDRSIPDAGSDRKQTFRNGPKSNGQGPDSKIPGSRCSSLDHLSK
jgi:hypothetical protein